MANTYPDVTAGTEITADLLNSMMPQYKWKTAATTRASTTAFADDPDLTMELEANSTYHVEFFLQYATTTAAGFKTEWTTPASSTGVKTVMGSAASVADTVNGGSGDGRWGGHGFTTDVTYGDRDSATNQMGAYERCVVVTTTAGTCAIRWAQEASTAVNTNLSAGSLMRVTRLA